MIKQALHYTFLREHTFLFVIFNIVLCLMLNNVFGTKEKRPGVMVVHSVLNKIPD